MAKNRRIDYKDHSRLTPKLVSKEIYEQNNKELALNFGSAFRMLKNRIPHISRNKKVKDKKPKKSKYEKRNRKFLALINNRITNPKYPFGEQPQLMELKKKIILQIQSNVYNQKSLEKLINSILNPARPLNV